MAIGRCLFVPLGHTDCTCPVGGRCCYSDSGRKSYPGK
jgi:hypothetical protein